MNNKTKNWKVKETNCAKLVFTLLFGLFIFLLVSQTEAHASWSGGSISARVSTSTSVFLANNADFNATGSTNNIVARYNNIYEGALWHLGSMQQNYAPIITLIAPNSNLLTGNSTVNVSYSIIDQNDDSLNCILYHSANPNPAYYSNVNTTSWSTISNSITSADNTYYWYVTCSDGTNTTQSATRNYTIDTLPPVVSLIYPADLSVKKIDVIDFNYSVNETNELSNCSLFTNESGTWSLTQTEILPLKETINGFQETLPDGYYRWNVICSDELSREGWDENRTFEVNSVPPGTITNLENTSCVNSSITWSWANPLNSDLAGIILYVDGNNILNLSSANSTYMLENLTGNTTHVLTINTYDAAGNINTTNITNITTTRPDFYNSSSVIIITSPAENITLTSPYLDVRYDAYNQDDITLCELYLDGINKNNNTNISMITTNYDIITNLSDGWHNLSIACSNNYGLTTWSSDALFRIINLNGFDQSTTNLTEVDLNNVTDFTLEVASNGKIVFPGAINLSGTTNIVPNVIIGPLRITVNSAALPILNRAAILEIYNVPYNNILIWKDSTVCTDCEIVTNTGTILTFNVTSFSTYIVTSTSSLVVTDDTETQVKYANESIMFYANYSNITNSEPLTGSCDISINDGGWSAPAAMTYNATSKQHTFEYTFESVNSFDYNVSCTTSDPGFDDLSVLNTAQTSPLPTATQRFVKPIISQDNSSRFSSTTATDAIDTKSGNVSELNINAIVGTSSWQGYFGNVTSSLVLADEVDNAFFKWNSSMTTGQIFASRSNSIVWETVACVAPGTISSENTYIGKTGSDKDSVNNTYSVLTHPHFVVGSRLLQNCVSTTVKHSETSPGNFWNVLIADSEGAGNAVYTSLINMNTVGFKNEAYDFELVVPVNGQTTNDVVAYYFFMELD